MYIYIYVMCACIELCKYRDIGDWTHDGFSFERGLSLASPVFTSRYCEHCRMRHPVELYEIHPSEAPLPPPLHTPSDFA